jgi:hypothetical protein
MQITWNYFDGKENSGAGTGNLSTKTEIIAG